MWNFGKMILNVYIFQVMNKKTTQKHGSILVKIYFIFIQISMKYMLKSKLIVREIVFT